MTRLTKTERAEIQRTSIQFPSNEIDVQSAIDAARKARAIYMAECFAKLWNNLGLSALACMVKRARTRRETLAALSGLNDKMLQDIGVNRSEIWRISAETSSKAHPYPKNWVSRLAGQLKLAAERHRTVSELAALDDRLLRDIGLERGSIREFAEARLENRDPAWQQDTAPLAEDEGFASKLGVAIFLPFYLLVQGAANNNEPGQRKAA